MEAFVTHGGRWLFGLCLLLSWMNSALHVVNARSMPYSRGMGLPLALSGHLILLLVGSVAYLSLVWFWVGGIHPMWTGLAIVCAIGTLQAWESRQWPGDTVVRLGKW